MKAKVKTAKKTTRKAAPKPTRGPQELKHEDYVFFTYSNKKYKGRISIENGTMYLCQDVHSTGSCTNQFGHEFAWAIVKVGNKNTLNNYIRAYAIEVVSKEVWRKHLEPITNSTLGWNFTKTTRGRTKNPTYSFGCGAVRLTRDEILEFAEHRDKYLAMIQERDETEERLRAQIVKEYEKVTNWLTEHEGANAVLTVLRQRSIKPERANTERLKRLFK